MLEQQRAINAFADPWQVLNHARSVVEPGLRSAVDSLAQPMRGIASYHLGWQDAEGKPQPGGGGKGFRSALVLLGARALGATEQQAVAPAVAVELVHNASLLHDDLMDGDRIRRHRPTAWALFGGPRAILTGDALLALAFEVVGRGGANHTSATWSLLSETLRQLIEGQSADMEFEGRADVASEDCLAMIAGKTGSLLGAACALGAAVAGADPGRVQYLRAFGYHLGLAYQLVDDVLGVWGAEVVTGKPVYSDLRQRKKSMPVVLALTSGSDAGEELAQLYLADSPLDEPDLARAAALIELAGGRALTEDEAQRQLERALAFLRAASPDAAAHDALAALATLVVRRDH